MQGDDSCVTYGDGASNLPIDRVGARLLFQIINRRYARGPMILTSTQLFSAWREVLGDRTIATAIFDRLQNHTLTMNIRGHSYCLKDKLKAGLIRSYDDSASQPGGDISTTMAGDNSVTLYEQCAPARGAPADRQATLRRSCWRRAGCARRSGRGLGRAIRGGHRVRPGRLAG